MVELFFSKRGLHHGCFLVIVENSQNNYSKIPGVPKKTLHNFKPVSINVASRYLKNIFKVQKTIT